MINFPFIRKKNVCTPEYDINEGYAEFRKEIADGKYENAKQQPTEEQNAGQCECVPAPTPAPTSILQPRKDFLVILGTAHLISTPGKRSPDGCLREYAYSRRICKNVQKELEKRGFRCIIDHEANDMPNPKCELTTRCNIVNKLCSSYGASNCVYVSIHLNAAGNGSDWTTARGWSGWVYTKASKKSILLAECLADAAKAQGLTIRKPTPTQRYWTANFTVIARTNCPAVLTENLFQDNRDEVEFLMSPAGEQAITMLHVNGILDYYDSIK